MAADGGQFHSAVIFDLPWEDVVFSHILCHLRLSQIFQLRRVCKTFRKMCFSYFKTCKNLDCSDEAKRLTSQAFDLMTRDNCSLQRLVLTNCRNFLKEEALAELLKRNPRLLEVDLSGCSSLTNSTLHMIAEHCRQLQAIRLSECRWVSPDGVIQMSLCCNDLEVVDLTGCWEITDQSVCSVASFCNNIRVFILNCCYSVSDNSVRVIGRSCPGLTSLGLQGCWRVSNEVIRHIGEYCENLKRLEVKGCRDVSEASLARLRLRGVVVDVPKPAGRYSAPVFMHQVPALKGWSVPRVNLNT